jgi:hypothetical protein
MAWRICCASAYHAGPRAATNFSACSGVMRTTKSISMVALGTPLAEEAADPTTTKGTCKLFKAADKGLSGLTTVTSVLCYTLFGRDLHPRSNARVAGKSRGRWPLETSVEVPLRKAIGPFSKGTSHGVFSLPAASCVEDRGKPSKLPDWCRRAACLYYSRVGRWLVRSPAFAHVRLAKPQQHVPWTCSNSVEIARRREESNLIAGWNVNRVDGAAGIASCIAVASAYQSGPGAALTWPARAPGAAATMPARLLGHARRRSRAHRLPDAFAGCLPRRNAGHRSLPTSLPPAAQARSDLPHSPVELSPARTRSTPETPRPANTTDR